MSDRRGRNRDERRAARRAGQGSVDRYTVGAIAYGPPVGPGMSVASPDQVARALRDVPSPDDWEGIAPGIVPLFERRRPFPFEAGRPIRALLPPGVSVTVGYDFGPGFMRVTSELAARWPVSESEIVATALANLRRRVRTALSDPAPPRVVVDSLDDLRLRALTSGEGWASTLLLAPELLDEVFGRAACLFIAPMRDLLIALPPEIPIDEATALSEGFEALDPNCLCLEAFGWDGRHLSVRPLSRGAAIA